MENNTSTEIEAEQGSPGWSEARLGVPTASEFGKVMSNGRGNKPSETRKKYCIQLALERITGRKTETYKSAAMQNGNDTEATAALQYMLATGSNLRRCGFFKHNSMETGASPDRLIVGERGGVEIKCPEHLAHNDTLIRRSVPSQYFWQITGQIWLADLEYVDYVSFNPDFPPNAALYIERVQRDEESITTLKDQLHDFLVEIDERVAFVKNYNN